MHSFRHQVYPYDKHGSSHAPLSQEQWYDRLLNWHLAPITRSNHCHLLFRTTSPKTYTAALERAPFLARRFAEHQYARPSTGTLACSAAITATSLSQTLLARFSLPGLYSAELELVLPPSHNGDLRARQRISRHPSRRLAHCLYEGRLRRASHSYSIR